jgi:hypothetical protein
MIQRRACYALQGSSVLFDGTSTLTTLQNTNQTHQKSKTESHNLKIALNGGVGEAYTPELASHTLALR